MPLPLLGAAAIGAGAQLLGSGINAWSTQQQNQASMQFAREMYDRQFADSLTFWNLQNSYNSPQAQMNRLQRAGLNPNLVYGNGNAVQAAGPLKTPDVQSPQFRTPEWGNMISGAGLGYMNSIYDLDIKQAQANNLEAQNNVIMWEALLKKAQVGSTLTGQERAQFELDLARELRDTSADYARERLRQTKVTTDLAINKDAREAALNASTVQEAALRMVNLREQQLSMQLTRAKDRVEITRLRTEIAKNRESVQAIRKDNVLRDLDIQLRKQGINPNDPMWARVVGRVLSRYFDAEGNPRSDSGSGGLLNWILGN